MRPDYDPILDGRQPVRRHYLAMRNPCVICDDWTGVLIEGVLLDMVRCGNCGTRLYVGPKGTALKSGNCGPMEWR